MRLIGSVLGVLALGVTLSGCWIQPGFDAGNSNWTSGEATITPANVDELGEIWSYDIGDGPAGSLLALNGKVFAGINTSQLKTLVGLDAASGDALWTYTPLEAPGSYFASNGVLVGGHIEFSYGTGSSIIKGQVQLDPNTGTELSRTGGGGITVETLAVADGELARGGRGGISSYVIWRCTATKPPETPNSYAFVGEGDALAWSSGSQALGFRDCATSTGTWGTTWATELGGRPTGVAAVGNGAAAYVDDTGTLSVLDATTGAIRWTAEMGVGATRPAVADGKILVATPDGRLVAFAADAGAPVWEATLGAAGGRPVVGGNVVYAPVGSDVLAFALDGCDAAVCPPLATLGAGSPVNDSPIVHDGRLLVGTTDGRVVAFGLPA